MRFRRLGLRAFGGFTSTELDFGLPGPDCASPAVSAAPAPGPADFHVVFGANEAGKSTTLRAITGFLFGIPERSRDTYLHAKQLRISAELDTPQGPLSLTRRKGRKSTLLDSQEQAVPESVLRAPLMGVDQAIYSALFGLDHMSLRAGGAAIARGEGQLGEALYAAGLGGGAVRGVLTRLREQAEALYLPRGKRRINVLEARRKQAQDAVNRATTPPESWKLQSAEVARRELEVEDLYRRRQELLREQSRLDALRRVSRLATRYLSARAELAALGDAVMLPPGFTAERERWLQQQADARRELVRRQSELSDVQRELSALGEPQAIATLDSAELEVLGQRLGSHAKAVVDLPKRHAELRVVEQEVSEALGALRLLPGENAELPGTVLRTELRSLSAEHARLEVMLATQLASVSECEARLAALAEEQRASGSVSSGDRLAAAVELAQRLGDPEQRLQQFAAEERQLAARIASARSALNLPSDLDVLQLRLPSRERVQAFQSAAEVRTSALIGARRALTAAQRELESISAQEKQLTRAANLPEADALQVARQERDALWGKLDDGLRRAELPAGQVVRDFQLSVATADQVADRLLGDAGRLAQLDQLRRRAISLAEEQRQAEQQLGELEAAAATEQAAWEAEFAAARGVDAPALLTWLGEVHALIRAASERERLVAERVQLEQIVRDHRQRLLAELARSDPDSAGLSAAEPAAAEAGSSQPVTQAAEISAPDLSAGGVATAGDVSLQGLLLIARARVKQLAAGQRLHDDQQRRHAELREQLAVLRSSLSHTQALHNEWRGAWEQALRRCGLPLDMPTSAVVATLESLAQLETRLATQRQLEGRVQGMQRDAIALARDLGELLQRYAPDLEGLDTARAGSEFRRRYLEQRERAERRRLLQQRAQHLEGEVAGFERAQREARNELAELCRVANVDEPAQLVVVEQRAAEHARLTQDVAERSRELLDAGQSLVEPDAKAAETAAGEEVVKEPLEAILTSTRHVAPTDLELRLREIESELPELDDAYRDAISGLEGSRQGLERLSTGSAAARGEELQEVVAELAREVQAYRRVKLAELILAREIERYRRENQGPILQRANQLFPALTLGRYSGLAVGFNTDDQAILEALPTGAVGEDERVRADDLSDGARDQLYLALRIASIERYIDAGARLPVVLDDILVHFDEQRARAALVALAELGTKTQVLFFTHHERHVELATEALGAAQVHFHRLSSSARH